MKLLLVMVFIHSLLALAPASKTPTVIIIGAGMSGISAAKTLHDAGIRDILILEATNRIGGRVMKTQFSGYAVEMGANWLFGGGPVHNPVLEMAEKVKLKTSLNDYDNLTSNTYKQDGGLYPKTLVEAVDKNDVDISILAGQRLFKQEPKTPLEMVVDYYHNDYEDGEPPKVTSLKHTYPRNEFVDHGEDPYFVADPRGFEIVVQYLAKQFLSSLKGDPRLKLNKVVREIIYSKNGVALPIWKRLAISDFSMTIYTKIFLKFPYKFWPTGPGTEFFIYTHVRRGYYPLWQHLENEYPGSNILFVTVTAEESRRVEQLSDQEVEAEVMAVLKTLFGNKIPKPEDILVPRWGSNRFYKGSYSNWPDKYSQHRHDQLGDPVGPVYFTGEHNSNRYIGYVTGAYFTGIDTADDLLGCIKNQTCRGYNSQQM
ncbi:FLAVIN MONOAMINE OXIDASE [Salix purpurea]|uniref:FLAVIN MONOAMINE OXIDASE n=1 Tax=Salix purpurea TaxID=77065 RepID=A0A9Q1A7G7_SALPP|nr:FLAVIN MONOAMINE OXIDASE [Salix purpurea]